MAWTGDVSTDMLNDFLLPRETKIIEEAIKYQFPIWNRVDKVVGKDVKFDGTRVNFRIQTSMGFNAAPRAEGGAVVTPRKTDFTTAYTTCKEFDGSAGMTQEERETCTPEYAIADLNTIKARDLITGMKLRMNAALGLDGTGRLARIATRAGARSYTCNNTQGDFGWPNVQMLRPGMLVDIYTVAGWTSGSAFTLKVSAGEIATVTYANDGSSGAFTLTSDATETSAPADNDVVFLHGSVTLDGSNNLSDFNDFVGLFGHISNAAETAGTTSGSWLGTTYQGLTRASYQSMKSYLWNAATIGGSAGTLTSWDKSDLDGCIMQIDEIGTGGGGLSALYMHPYMRDTLNRKSIIADNVFVPVTDGKVTPGLSLDGYKTQTGKVLPIITGWNFPNHHIFGVNENDFSLQLPIPIRYDGPNGEKGWFPEPGGRSRLFELWARCKGQLVAHRNDNCFVMRDLKVE